MLRAPHDFGRKPGRLLSIASNVIDLLGNGRIVVQVNETMVTPTIYKAMTLEPGSSVVVHNGSDRTEEHTVQSMQTPYKTRS